jgi:hypothetical protein
MRPRFPRLVGWIVAVILGIFVIGWGKATWRNYWLLSDGQEGVAVVTTESWSGHNAVNYRYTVNQKEYAGTSTRNWQQPKYGKVQVGDQSVVYFSASHPWLSLLYKPRAAVEGLPVLLIALLLELFAVASIINPRSKWAFNLSDGKRRTGAG